MELKEKVAIVVGGASGIGKATARLLAEQGASVLIADLDIDMANQVVAEIEGAGGIAIAVKIDMTRMTEADAMARTALDRFGQIDILVNVAGGSVGRFIREKMRPFPESTEEEWDKLVDVNLKGARNCARAVINHMIERGRGKIVSFSSTAGVHGAANAVDYSAAKAGLIGFTKALAMEMAPFGIQVNCISPSGVATERIVAFAKARQEENPQAPGMDLSRLAKPEEVASTVLYLVSDQTASITGENIVITGHPGPTT